MHVTRILTASAADEHQLGPGHAAANDQDRSLAANDQDRSARPWQAAASGGLRLDWKQLSGHARSLARTCESARRPGAGPAASAVCETIAGLERGPPAVGGAGGREGRNIAGRYLVSR